VGLAAKLHSGCPSSAFTRRFSELMSELLHSVAIVSDEHMSKASAVAALLKSNLSFPQAGIKNALFLFT